MGIVGIPAGAVVQRLGPRTTMLISDAARVPIIGAVPLLHELGGLSFGLILVLAALSGLFSTAYFTCQRVIIPAVVGYDEQLIGAGEQPDRGDDERDQPGRPGAGRRPDRSAGRGERHVARRGVVSRSRS